MRVLLTGSTGFVGQNLLNHLNKLGWQTETIVRNDSDEDIDRKMRDFKPNLVIHLATLFIAEHKASDISALIQSNIVFGTRVVDAMVRRNVLNLVNAGTLWQYYEGQREIPSSLYSATKTAFEKILRYYSSANRLRVINLMLSDTFGAKDPRQKLLPKLLSIAGTNEKLQLSAGEQIVEWTYISDVVEAFAIAAQRLAAGNEPELFVSYTATSGEQHSLRETVALCENILGKTIPVEFGAKPYRKREIMKPSKLDPPLPGWRPKMSFVEGIEACLYE